MTKYHITAIVEKVGRVQHTIAKPTQAEAEAKFKRAYPGRNVVFTGCVKGRG